MRPGLVLKMVPGRAKKLPAKVRDLLRRWRVMNDWLVYSFVS